MRSSVQPSIQPLSAQPTSEPKLWRTILHSAQPVSVPIFQPMAPSALQTFIQPAKVEAVRDTSSLSLPQESMEKVTLFNLIDEKVGMTLDQEYMVEVFDPKHRYVDNLRCYFNEFRILRNNSTEPVYWRTTLSATEVVFNRDYYKDFFYWLDHANMTDHEVK